MDAVRPELKFARREDDRLVTGQGRYADDVTEPAALTVVFVRSPYASARIEAIDTRAALAHPGVVAVLTGADVRADGIDECPAPFVLESPLGGRWMETRRPLLAQDCVRHVGEPVAMVLAENRIAAQDAAELVQVDYDPQPVVSDMTAAAAEGAPRVWPDRPGNLAFRWIGGGTDAIEAALAASHHVTRLRSRVSRVSAAPMEPRSAAAWLDEGGRLVLRASYQSPHQLRNEVAAVFRLERSRVRVLAGDVGGSFGMKSGKPREELALCWAALRMRRALRWTASRSESFLADDQGRDAWISTELGLDAQGGFTALRVRFDLAIGPWMTWRSTAQVMNVGGIAGVYRTPVIVGEVQGWFTHTPLTAPYRGAGRPEATYAIERAIDLAAAELGLDPAGLRRRNLIAPEAMPYQTPFVFRYDCGDFERNMDRALALAGYDEFPARRALALQRGRLRGIGMANPIEVAAGPYARPGTDWARVQAHPDGTVSLLSGVMSVGQGHETALSALAAQDLGLPPECVRFVQGDTDAIPEGRGNGGSAATITGGAATALGVADLVAQARRLAARQLEVAEEDLAYAAGVFRVPGSDLSIGLGELARIAQAQEGAALAGQGQFTPASATFPNGCHVCEVEIDPDTGAVQVVAYTSVEDVGRVLDAVRVEGQIQGGVAQGVGQALMEEIRIDDQGQVLTGSFMDYALPRAADIPGVVSETPETPTQLNPLGVKGVGEAGTVGALAATMNAVCHALSPAGIRHFDMPATPQRVWQALRDAGFPA